MERDPKNITQKERKVPIGREAEFCSPFRCLLSQEAETLARYTGGEGTPICNDMWS